MDNHIRRKDIQLSTNNYKKDKNYFHFVYHVSLDDMEKLNRDLFFQNLKKKNNIYISNNLSIEYNIVFKSEEVYNSFISLLKRLNIK